MSLSKKLRFEILERDDHTCHYCGWRAPYVELHVDHIVPRSKGGGDNRTNLITSCAACNLGKGATVSRERIEQDEAIVLEAEELSKFIYCDPIITAMYGEPVI